MYLMVSTHLEKLHIVLLMSFTKCKEKVGTWITQLCNALKRKNQPTVLAKTTRQMAQGLTKVCSSGDEEGRDDRVHHSGFLAILLGISLTIYHVFGSKSPFFGPTALFKPGSNRPFADICSLGSLSLAREVFCLYGGHHILS